MEIQNLSRDTGLELLSTVERKRALKSKVERKWGRYLNCCEQCEVAQGLGSVDICPQRVFTANSCCPSCSLFLEHGLEAMLVHWENAQIFGAIQIAIPLTVQEEDIRSGFHLHKARPGELRIQYQWGDWGFIVNFEKHVNWVALLQHMYLPLNLDKEFLRDPLIYGLAGFPERAGATLFAQLCEVLEDFKKWVSEFYSVTEAGAERIFARNAKNIAYYAGYFFRFEDKENIAIDILAPDYGLSVEPERCLVRIEPSQMPVVSYNKIRELMEMEKGVVSAWEEIEPNLNGMLNELNLITTEIHTAGSSELSESLYRVQGIQGQFLKIKPVITNMRGSISPIVPLLSEPLVRELFPNFNIDLVNNWLEYSKSVERSVEGTSSFINSKLSLLSFQQEKKVTKRLNLLTALFGSLSGFNLILAFIGWIIPQPTLPQWFILASFIIGLTALTIVFVLKAMPEE